MGSSAASATVELPSVTTLPNGVTLLLVRRGAVPLVALRWAVPLGAAAVEKGGLAQLALDLLRRGARGRSAHAIDEALEGLGCDLAVAVADDTSRLGLTVPAPQLDTALALLSDLAVRPTFPARELGALRQRTVASIRAGLDDAGEVAERAFYRTMLPAHPYGRPLEGRSRDVQGLTRADALAFHRRWLHTSGACLVAAGGLPPGAERKLAALGARLPSGGPAATLAAPAPLAGRRVLVVDKPDATQAQIRIGGGGIAIGSADLIACVVGNAVLGGGFSSRLVNEVRVERGLAYGVSSRFQAWLRGGIFSIQSSTRVEQAASLVQVCLDQVARLRDSGAKEFELRQARAYAKGRFEMDNETGEQVASTVADRFLHGLGVDWIRRYPKLVDASSRAEVRAAMGKYLPGPYRIVAVGPARPLARALRRFGAVEVVGQRAFL